MYANSVVRQRRRAAGLPTVSGGEGTDVSCPWNLELLDLSLRTRAEAECGREALFRFPRVVTLDSMMSFDEADESQFLMKVGIVRCKGDLKFQWTSTDH